ncbi:uncharacterized protein at5g23160 [Phtheirospermum japonicum]|uniref:Uncharacterized protein at5g23160 n=1 Tax=Phtheirospermum japonicum TaxID=374723 RepID=A0A830C0C6_9LAMI|nr:uncharacterized protein at5g23160 [Phtheirospermum japonicum]
MAADQNSKNKISKKHKLMSCFACFGFYHEKQESNIANEKLVKYGTRTSSGRARARTVPISHSSKEIHVVEASDDQLIVAPQIQSQQVNNKKVHDMFKKNKKISKSSRVMGSFKFDKNSSTQETWSKPVKLLKSVSLPPPQPEREKPTAGGGGSGEKSEKGGQSINPGQLDPMVGAIIMMVTLIVMLIWGKICAIICTAAWFYIIPRFKANNDFLNINKLKNGSEHIDVDSWENKKKVVFEGFLERY